MIPSFLTLISASSEFLFELVISGICGHELFLSEFPLSQSELLHWLSLCLINFAFFVSVLSNPFSPSFVNLPLRITPRQLFHLDLISSSCCGGSLQSKFRYPRRSILGSCGGRWWWQLPSIPNLGWALGDVCTTVASLHTWSQWKFFWGWISQDVLTGSRLHQAWN